MGIDVDFLLREETYLLFRDAQSLKASEFVKIASRESLRQEDWSRFWKMVRNEAKFQLS